MNPIELLKNARVEVAPETFFLVSLPHNDWLKLLENPELSPRMTAPFMIFRDQWEVTLLLDDIDFGTIRYAIRDAKIQGNFRLLSFDIALDFAVVGFLAEISRILAQSKHLNCCPFRFFTRPHFG
ncbi:MAG: hypothetical protein WKF71_13330 [Pyrinomonadaceae bacterium]